MPAITAFDSKDFKRSNRAGDLKFFSPLGCGVKVTKTKEFHDLYIENMTKLLTEFDVSPVCGCLASSEFFPSAGYSKTYKIADNLLKSIQDLIESVFISYVILPSTTIPTVEVGGYRSPKREIATFDFLRTLSNYFSYITAWTYLNQGKRNNEQILVDGFRGKITYAWESLLDKTFPIVYPHGDECNVFISTADMVASLTDKKLYDKHMRLRPEDITHIWEEYNFDVETRFLDQNSLPQIKWINDKLINASNQHAKPTIFLKADGYTTDDIKKLSVYPDATLLARKLNGCLQGFDKKIDTPKIRNGDVFIYAGKEAEENARTLTDMYKLQTMPFKEIKERIKLP